MVATIVKSDLRERNVITVPPEVRQALHVSPGDSLAFQLEENGTVTVQGLKAIPADQAWFWTPEWQAKEREATKAINEGRFDRFDNHQAFLDTFGE